MIDPFPGARLKLVRAEQHIEEVRRAVDQFVSASFFKWEKRPAPKDGWTEVVLRFTGAIPDELSVMVGDALHNMRSSLDNMTFALAHRNGVTSRSKLSQVYFPMGQSPAEFDAACDKLAPLIGSSASEAIKLLEVYDGGAGASLKQLGALSNMDKHRLLIPALPQISGSMTFGLTNETINKGADATVEIQVGPLLGGKVPAEDGDVLFSYPTTNHPDAAMRYFPRLTASFASHWVPRGEDAVSTLKRLRLAALSAVQDVARATMQ